MNILVLGGTRFFGIPMVKALIKQGHNITIATMITIHSIPIKQNPVALYSVI